MTADIETTKTTPIATASQRTESRVRVRYRAPFALRCGAVLIDYIVLALVLTFSILIARLMGGGARLAGGTAEKVGLVLTFIVAVADLGVLAGITGRSIGKWTTGLRTERIGGGAPGIGRALLRHFIGYPLSLLPLGLGFLVATVTPTGRALHDFISGTVVVRKNAALTLPTARRIKR
ncbi:MAG: RDD family protein [Pyrinomonadaceae bacterium]